MTSHILGDNAPRKSNFDPDLAKKLTKYYEEHPEELIDKPEVSPAPTDTAKQSVGKYIQMPKIKTYALGLQALQEECVKENNQNHPLLTLPFMNITHFRPLTFKENCLARLKQFNTLTNPDGSPRTLEQRAEFMLTHNDSCCSIAYPSKNRESSKFKLTLQSPELIMIFAYFNEAFLPVNYTQLSCTRELDRKGAKYNLALTPAEIDSHEGWLTLFEDDATALHDYRKMFEEALALIRPQDRLQKFMSFRILSPPLEDQLRALLIYDINWNSDAVGYIDLNSDGSFLRRSPSSDVTK